MAGKGTLASASNTNLRREALDVGMAELPERLPHPPPVLQPRVLHEVGLADVAADGREEVHERLQRGEREASLTVCIGSVVCLLVYVTTAGQAQGAPDLHTIAKPSALG